jgi:hypothetical protein
VRTEEMKNATRAIREIRGLVELRDKRRGPSKERCFTLEDALPFLSEEEPEVTERAAKKVLTLQAAQVSGSDTVQEVRDKLEAMFANGVAGNGAQPGREPVTMRKIVGFLLARMQRGPGVGLH